MKKNRLSFGIDWSEGSVKIVGLRMLRNGFELTHCLLFELPGHYSRQEAAQLIRNRLGTINFHGGMVTINFPVELNLHAQSGSSPISRIRKALAVAQKPGDSFDSPPTLILDADEVEEVGALQAELPGCVSRIELPDLALPLLDDKLSSDYTLYLFLGMTNSRITLAKGKAILDHRTIPFSVEHFLFKKQKQEARSEQKYFRYLKSAWLRFSGDKWEWHSNLELENANDLQEQCRQATNKLAVQLKTYLTDKIPADSRKELKIQLVGPGALFPWLPSALEKLLQTSVQKVDPFARLTDSSGSVQSKRLQQIAPIFAQAVAMALSGSEKRKSPSPDLSKKIAALRNRQPGVRHAFRLAALGVLFICVAAYFVLSLATTQLSMKSQIAQHQIDDMAKELNGFKNRRLYTSSSQPFQEDLSAREFSRTFLKLSEWLPSGCWLEDVHLVPAKNVPYLREKKSSKGWVFVFAGKAISGKYILSFFETLRNSGYFATVAISKKVDPSNSVSNSIPFEIAVKVGGGS